MRFVASYSTPSVLQTSPPIRGEIISHASNESCRSLLGELSNVARLRGFNIQPVIASNSEAIQDDIHSFFDFYLDRRVRFTHSR